MMGAVARAARRAELLLLLLGLAAGLLAAEAVVRVLALAEPRPSGYAPVNTSLPARRQDNALGYRDRERSLAKPSGVRRVVSLGDSFAWGVGVERDDAYPQRLERALGERRAGERWEVVNLALPGMNTVDEAAQLDPEGLAYAPDVVLLGYVLNDSEDAAAAERRRAREWGRGPELGPLARSALVRLVAHRLWATAENRSRVAGYLSMFEDGASGWQASRQALARMGARCREAGIPFVVAIFPLFGNPLDDRYPFEAIHAKVAAAAAAAGAHVVDLLPVFRGLRSEALVVGGADDEHPNEVAHRIAAGAIRRALDAVVPPLATAEAVR